MWFFILPLIIFIFVNIFSVVNGLGAINILFFGKWIALTFSSYWWLIQCALGAEAVQGELLTYSPDAIIRLIWIFLPLSFIWLRSFKTWPLRLVLGILIIVSMVLTANKKAGQTFITADVGIENLQKIPIIGSLFAAPTPVINGQTVAKKGMSANRRKIIASALALVLVIGIVMALYFAKTVTQKMLGLLIITIGIFGFWFVAPASVNKELKKLSQNKDHAININIDSLVAQMQLFARDSNRMELYNTAQKLKEAYKAQAEFTKFPDSLCLEFKDYFYERCH